MTLKTRLSAEDIEEAFLKLKDTVKQTPLEKDMYLSQKFDCNVYLKREDLQWVRSFKLRGAYYAINQLTDEERANGVSCASAGNHAQGIAFTAKQLEIKAVIFMPVTTPAQKINQVKFFGGEFVQIELIGDTFDDCLKHALDYTEQFGLSFIDQIGRAHV